MGRCEGCRELGGQVGRCKAMQAGVARRVQGGGRGAAGGVGRWGSAAYSRLYMLSNIGYLRKDSGSIFLMPGTSTAATTASNSRT